MKSKTMRILLVPTILGLAWFIVMLILCGFIPKGAIQLFAILFGLLAFIIVLAVIRYVCEQTDGTEDASYGPIAAYSGVFLFLSVALNTVFHILRPSGMMTVFFVANIALLAIYLVLAIGSINLIHTNEQKSIETEQKTTGADRISGQIAELMNVSEGETREKLAKLKETVDFSTNVTGKKTGFDEKSMQDQLSMIAEAISAKADPEAILQMIQDANIIWKNRNSMLS